METTAKKFNPITWFIQYIKEARAEMTKVTWPSKQETTRYALVVVVLSLVIAGFFGGLDWLLTKGLEQLVEITSA